MTGSNDLLATGEAALKTANWPEAKKCFEAALQVAETPEAHSGLGLALWWLNEIPAAHEHRSAAYLGFKQQGNLRAAALLASWLAREQVFLNANYSAMRGWFASAERLLDAAGPCVEQEWFTLFRASVLASPIELEQVARGVLHHAKEFGDADLEAVALAFAGIARVTLGQVAEGMLDLDEAMAAATGGEIGYPAVSEIFCLMLSACDLAGDLARTEQWCQVASEFAEKHHCPFLAATCRTTYGSLLTATGRWREAEVELTGAIRSFEAGHRALRAAAVIKLAELRVCEGKLEEAEVLLSGYEDQGAAQLPLARLYLARGQAEHARAVLEQALPSQALLTLDQIPVLRLLVDVHLTLGNLDQAVKLTAQLEELAQQTSSPLLLAQADLARGQLKRRLGETDAILCFQSALDRLHTYEQSLLASRTRLELARLLSASDRPAAVTWARAALASFERMGAAHDADEAANLLRQLGTPPHPGPRLQSPLTQREGEVLTLLKQGLSNREIAGRLVVSPKTVEHHVGQILSKLGAHSRAEAAAFAASHPLSDLTEPSAK